MKRKPIVNITVVAAMSAVATVIYMLFPEIPLVPGVSYLKLDFSDIPAIAAGITLGPVQGILVEVIKNIIHLSKTTTYGIGEIMNVVIGGGMIVSLCGFTKLFSRLLKKSEMSAATYYIAAVLAVFATILIGWMMNAAMTPIFFKLSGIPITAAAIKAGVWGSTLLNAVKAAFNLLPFYPVYFALHRTFRKINK